MARILIENALTVATFDDAMSELEGGDVLIEGKSISAIGTGLRDKAGPLDEIIDARGCVVMPGMVNTHHHLYQTLQRALPAVQDGKLFDWLTTLYEIWREVSAKAAGVSARVGLSELLLTGCTTVADHFYLFPEKEPDTILDMSIGAARELGVRFHPTRGSMSRGKSKGGLPPDDVVQTEAAIKEDSLRVIEAYHEAGPFSMCSVSLAPCSPFSVTEELLRETAVFAREKGVRLHTHLAETKDEEVFCLETKGLRPLAYMDKVGWVGPDVWFAHCVHMNDDEIARMAETGTGVAHCPTSNLRLGSGIAPIPKMLDAGVPVGLAVDGSASNDASNMLAEARMAMMVHRVGTAVDEMPARRAFYVATRGGASVLGRKDIGRLEKGAAADVVLWNMEEVAFAGAMHDPLAALLFCCGTQRARTVLVNGEVRVRDGAVVGLDERALFEEANEVAAKMAEAAKARTGIDFLKRIHTHRGARLHRD